MPLAGPALLVLWSDTLPDADAAWRAWHVREHMPDRMTVPGIELGRRYLDRGRKRHQTFMMYEAREIEVFQSPAYLAQMNDPSAETRRLLPSIRNILRGVCRVVASEGAGIGETLATVRLVLKEPDGGITPGTARELVEAAVDQLGITQAHVAVVDREVTGIPTTEQKLRHDADDALDAVLLLEGSRRSDLAASVDALTKSGQFHAIGASSHAAAVYDLVYLLAAKTAG
jgi:hypothetical protein